MSSRSGSHSELFYHFVWTTKNRADLIDPDIELAVRKALYAKGEELQITILEVNGTADHIHVLLRSNSSVAPADIAKHLKGSSSHFVNHVTLKEDKVRSLYWQDGYAVISVSPGAVSSVRKYIQNQKVHHSRKSLKVEFEV